MPARATAASSAAAACVIRVVHRDAGDQLPVPPLPGTRRPLVVLRERHRLHRLEQPLVLGREQRDVDLLRALVGRVGQPRPVGGRVREAFLPEPVLLPCKSTAHRVLPVGDMEGELPEAFSFLERGASGPARLLLRGGRRVESRRRVRSGGRGGAGGERGGEEKEWKACCRDRPFVTGSLAEQVLVELGLPVLPFCKFAKGICVAS